MINLTCSKCGCTAQDGDVFYVLVDPNDEWWLQLFGNEHYCEKCVGIAQGTQLKKKLALLLKKRRPKEDNN